MDIDEMEIVFENEQLLVINKPAGLTVHGDGRSQDKTLADWLLMEYPKIREIGEPWEAPGGEVIYRPGIVHRLDRDTSGVMVIAKDQDTYLFLKQQFKDRKTQKTYHAIVYGNIKEEGGSIDKPIGKSRNDFRRWSADPNARGMKRDAMTIFNVLGRTEDKKYCYLELIPQTGRTHQLRVHMKAIHHPLVCDRLYAPNRECAFGFERQALHALSIGIGVPGRGEQLFEASFPQDFVKAREDFNL